MATTFPVSADTSNANQGLDALIAQLIKVGKQAGLTQAQIDKMVGSVVKAKTEGVQSVDAVGKSMSGVNDIAKKGTELIAAYFAVDKIKDFVGEVVRVTAEFQRLEAVLTNTLGSNSMARAALQDIQKLAAATPFSVRELSDSFVKLANRGVKPTMDEMRKMGDLAAVLGKPFEQVVEALLDINNQERWKEIGVKAETLGNKVKLSFKGMTYEVDRTVQGVTDAAVKLGELEGVAGSMSAISKTLGGQISNLGDAWDTFLNTVGQGNNGVLSGTVSLLSQAITKATELLSTNSQRSDKRSLGVYNEQRKSVQDIYEAGGVTLEQARDKALANLREELKSLDEEEVKLNVLRGLEQERINNSANLFVSDEKLKLLKNQLSDVQLKYNDLVNEGQLAILEYVAAEQKDEDLKKKMEADAAKSQWQKDEVKRNKELKDSLDALAEAMQNVDNYYNKHVNPIKSNLTAKVPGVNPNGIVTSIPGAQQGGPELNPDKSSDIYDPQIAALANFKQYSIQAMGEIFQFNQQGIQNEMTALQTRYNYELGLVGNNKEAQQKLAKDYNKQMMKLQNEQAAAQREQAIFGIVVNEGPAIAKAIATAPFPINLGIGLVIAAMFGAILGKTKSTQTPRFAEGVYGLKGPGTDNSDSINAWLSRDESVVPAKKSRNFKDILQPMIEDEKFGWTDVRRIIDDKMPSLNVPLIINASNTQASGDLINEVKALRTDIKNKKEFHWHITEDGLSMITREKDQWTRYVNKRYKRTA